MFGAGSKARLPSRAFNARVGILSRCDLTKTEFHIWGKRTIAGLDDAHVERIMEHIGDIADADEHSREIAEPLVRQLSLFWRQVGTVSVEDAIPRSPSDRPRRL